MSLTASFVGSATEYAAGNGDVSQVASGSTYGIFSFKNTSNVPIKLHYRQSDTSDDSNVDLSPGDEGDGMALTTPLRLFPIPS